MTTPEFSDNFPDHEGRWGRQENPDWKIEASIQAACYAVSPLVAGTISFPHSLGVPQGEVRGTRGRPETRSR
jgi:hypothetical protein